MAIRRISPRRRRLLMFAAVIAVFAAALLGWASGPSNTRPRLSPGGERALAAPTAEATVTATPSVSSSSGRPSKGPGSTALVLPDLPESTAVDSAGQPARSVAMTITSDAAIVRMGYIVRGGNPQKYATTNVRSPALVTTTAHGYGLVAEIGAQASPYATYITCTVTVDGQVHSHHTVRGPWSVAVCIG